MPVYVSEVGIVAPDVAYVKVRDGDIVRGNLVKLEESDPSGPTNAVLQRTNPRSGQLEYCRVDGLNDLYLRFYDTPPDAFLDRDDAFNIANYGTIGGRTITQLLHWIRPWEQGYWSYNGINQAVFVQMEHTIYFVLDGNLPKGTHTISNTAGAFPDAVLEFDDKRLVCPSIHVNQVGHMPTDGSKRGYLSNWVPGLNNEGEIDFLTDYGFSAFHIIDESGDVQHTGTIVNRFNYDTEEGGFNNRNIASAASPPQIVEAITNANPGVVTITGHGFTTGGKVLFSGIAGMTQLEGLYYTITVIDADNFSIGVDTTSYGTFSTTGTYTDDTRNQCWAAAPLKNRCGTYVHDIDYSSFAPTTYGKYRVWIPGLGVSWPFNIDPAATYEACKVIAKGYMAQCWGLDLSSGFAGWNRPANYRDGKGGAEVFETTMPACLDTECGMIGGTLAAQSHTATWKTSTRITDWFGGASDAGDWDFHHWRHCIQLYNLLDLGYDRLHSSKKNTPLGFPKSSQTIGGVYDSTSDALADVLHMVIWYLEPFRRFQKVDGSVYSGSAYNSTNFPGGGNDLFPSWTTYYSEMYIQASDHCSTLHYAAVAAKLGKLIKEAGLTTLGDIWIDSAVDAYNWASPIYDDYETSGILGTAWVAHYLTNLDVKTKSGWDDATLESRFDSVQTQAEQARWFALGCLWAATETAAYSTEFENAGFTLNQSGLTSLGMWEWIRHPATNSTFADYYDGRWSIGPDNQLQDHFNNVSPYSIGLNDSLDFMNPPATLTSLVYAYLTDDTVDETSKYLKLLHDTEGYVFGANQESLCCTTGLGSVHPHLLLRDREAMGIDSNDVPGITCYSWSPIVGGGLVFFNFSTDSSLNFTAVRSLGTQEVTFGSKKLVYPHNKTVPPSMSHHRNTYIIFNTEYDLSTSVLSRLAHNLFRYGHDATGTTELTNAPVSASISF